MKQPTVQHIFAAVAMLVMLARAPLYFAARLIAPDWAAGAFRPRLARAIRPRLFLVQASASLGSWGPCGRCRRLVRRKRPPAMLSWDG